MKTGTVGETESALALLRRFCLSSCDNSNSDIVKCLPTCCFKARNHIPLI